MCTIEDVTLPARLVESVSGDPPESPRRAWLAELPGLVRDLATRWRLRVGAPYQPGGSTSWVAPAERDGEHLVLKLGWRHVESWHEADALRVWAGAGAVRLLEARVDDRTDALLIEACEPGEMLSRSLPPEQQDVVLAGLLRRLWVIPPSGHPFRPLADMCAWWTEEFKRRPAPDLDPGLVRAGIDLLCALPVSAPRQTLLCTDLHPDNVLSARREPWLAIDPKPYVGDPTYDALQHMLNFPDRLAADATGFADRMAGLLELDSRRLRLWLFARCVQESPDQRHLARVAAALAP